jgi:hypothetical protein
MMFSDLAGSMALSARMDPEDLRYADPNCVPPKTQSKKSTRHRVIRATRARTSRGFEQYSVNPPFPYRLLLLRLLLLRLLALLAAIERIPDDFSRVIELAAARRPGSSSQ